MPDTLLSDSTKSLNQSGMFLQSLISKELDFDGWSVDTEYPVQVDNVKICLKMFNENTI